MSIKSSHCCLQEMLPAREAQQVEVRDGRWRWSVFQRCQKHGHSQHRWVRCSGQGSNSFKVWRPAVSSSWFGDDPRESLNRCPQGASCLRHHSVVPASPRGVHHGFRRWEAVVSASRQEGSLSPDPVGSKLAWLVVRKSSSWFQGFRFILSCQLANFGGLCGCNKLIQYEFRSKSKTLQCQCQTLTLFNESKTLSKMYDSLNSVSVRVKTHFQNA